MFSYFFLIPATLRIKAKEPKPNVLLWHLLQPFIFVQIVVPCLHTPKMKTFFPFYGVIELKNSSEDPWERNPPEQLCKVLLVSLFMFSFCHVHKQFRKGKNLKHLKRSRWRQIMTNSYWWEFCTLNDTLSKANCPEINFHLSLEEELPYAVVLKFT